MYPALEFAAISLSSIFFIVDPLGTAPIFLAITEGQTAKERNRTALRANVVTFLILVVFAFVGEWILKLLRVTISSFQIAGGILIFTIALSMLQVRRSRAKSTPQEEHEKQEGEDVAIFPLAIPMLSGPAAITTVMVLINLATSPLHRMLVILSITLTGLFCYLILRASGTLLNLLGRTGINVLTRLMGLLLAVISVQFVIDGIKAAFLGVLPGK